MTSKTAQPIINTLSNSNLLSTNNLKQQFNNKIIINHKKIAPTVGNGPTLLSRVLHYRQLLYADELFTVSDYDIITELVCFLKIF